MWPDIVSVVGAACRSAPASVKPKLSALASNFRSVRATIVALPDSAFDRGKSAEQLRTLNTAVLPVEDRNALKPLYEAFKSLGGMFDDRTKSKAGYAKWLESVARGIDEGGR